jgi:hypothetical protein
VRCITRLDETCREVRDAARVIGDAELFKKMEEAQMKIKRDSEWFSSFSSIFNDQIYQLYSQPVCIFRTTAVYMYKRSIVRSQTQ